MTFFADNFLRKYQTLSTKKSNLNLYSYCLAQGADHDIDFVNIIVGANRSGKSSLLYQVARRFYAYRMGFKKLSDSDYYLLNEDFNTRNVIYTKSQSMESTFKGIDRGLIGADEMIFQGDRRESMQAANINLYKIITSEASRNNVSMLLIENLSNLDSRFLSKANSILMVLERGRALLFVKEHNFQIIKDPGFQIFEKQPWLLSNYEAGIYNLKTRIPMYCCEIRWAKFENNLLFDDYKMRKRYWHEKMKQAV